jgi:hypothetical protein
MIQRTAAAVNFLVSGSYSPSTHPLFMVYDHMDKALSAYIYASVILVTSFMALAFAYWVGAKRKKAQTEPLTQVKVISPSSCELNYSTEEEKEDQESVSVESPRPSRASQELASFLEFGKTFLSPEFLREMLEADSTTNTCSSNDQLSDSANSDSNVPPGFEEVADLKETTKPACDIRNWRALDKPPSLNNTRTLSAFHNLNASRKVPHHFYPDPVIVDSKQFKSRRQSGDKISVPRRSSN